MELKTWKLAYGDSRAIDIARIHRDVPELRGAIVWYDINGWKTDAGIFTGDGEPPSIDARPLGNGMNSFLVCPVTDEDAKIFREAYGESVVGLTLE